MQTFQEKVSDHTIFLACFEDYLNLEARFKSGVTL